MSELDRINGLIEKAESELLDLKALQRTRTRKDPGLRYTIRTTHERLNRLKAVKDLLENGADVE